MLTINVVERNPYAPRPFVFTEVAVCLRDSIRAAGYMSDHLVNRIDPQVYSIVLGVRPETEGDIEHLDPSRCAIFNLEQLGSDSRLAGDEYLRWLASWVVLDYHNWNVRRLKQANGATQCALELPVLPSPSLISCGSEERNVDVLFYGTMNDRRAQVLGDLKRLGLTTEVVAGAYGPELSPAIRRARLVLHAHFYDTGLFPVARVLQPAVMGVPIVCETSVFSFMNDWSDSGIVFSHHQALASTCQAILRDPDALRASADRVRDFYTRLDFASPLLKVVKALSTKSSRNPPACLGDALEYDEVSHILFAGPGLQDSQNLIMPIASGNIEDLHDRKDAQMNPPNAPVAPFEVARREPGKTWVSKALVWVFVAFIALGSLRYWLSWKL